MQRPTQIHTEIKHVLSISIHVVFMHRNNAANEHKSNNSNNNNKYRTKELKKKEKIEINYAEMRSMRTPAFVTTAYLTNDAHIFKLFAINFNNICIARDSFSSQSFLRFGLWQQQQQQRQPVGTHQFCE